MAAAVWGFGLALFHLGRPNRYADFFYPWFAARVLLQGHSPYEVIPGHGAYPFQDPFSYPLPTVLAVTPVASLPYHVAGAVFFAVSSALLAYGITRSGFYRLPLFLSASYVSAASHAQWSPLIMASALLPSLGFLAVLKPNLGIAVLAYRPTLRAVIGGALVLLLSLVVLPSWPVEWLGNLGTLALHSPPLRTAGGALLLLALLRWRWPEARLLVAMACVPQLLFWNDQLLLWLIPRTLRESLMLSIASFVAAILWMRLMAPGAQPAATAAPYVIALLYIPALIMVLLRPARPHTDPLSVVRHAHQPDQPRSAGTIA